MPSNGSTAHHPFTSLIQLLLLILGGALLFTGLAFVIAMLMYRIDGLVQFRQFMIGNSKEMLAILRTVQIISASGTFIIPALIFARLQNGGISSYLQLDKRVPVVFFLVSIALVFTAMPMMEWAITVNKQMQLPEFLKELENWMKAKEDELARLTKQLLIMDSVSDLLINLLMIAVIPAIGEEFIFRGCLQKIFTRWTNNYHWGIWIAAIIFSAIHVQFYGFIPRMLLGALFGYLFVWGKSLWLPVLAHFVNNANTVIIAYIYQSKGQSLDKLDETGPLPYWLYLTSIVFTAFLLNIIYRKYQKESDIIISE